MTYLEEAKRHIRALLNVDDPNERYWASQSAQAFLSRLDGEGQTVEGGDDDVLEIVVAAMIDRPSMSPDQYRYADWLRDSKMPEKPGDHHHEAKREMAIEWLDVRRAEARAAIAVMKRRHAAELTRLKAAQCERRTVLEEAIKIVCREATRYADSGDDESSTELMARDIETAIRSLMDQPAEDQS